MRKALLTLACALGIAASVPTAGMALPLTGADVLNLRGTTNQVEEARLFCANRYTGVFLYWGRCRRQVAMRPSRPRVYCKNRYTGKFIHWGFC